VYEADKIRGRGAWLDDGRAVIHLGDRLLVNGAEESLSSFKSCWTYERAARLTIDVTAKPASRDECALLIDVCCGLAFTDPARDPRLLAGWLVIARLAGMLRWRPHLWLTSEIGGGKTHIVEKIVLRALGDTAKAVASKSSEPGIRRMIKNDARPIVFDEAEGDTQEAQRRVQAIIELMRQASSDSSAELIQALSGSSADVLSFRPKFIGMLSSVHLTLAQPADISRFITMSLREATAEEMAESQRREAACFTPGFSDRLFALAMERAPIIMANTLMLRDAIAQHGNKRAGDTLGTVLAGYLALQNDTKLTAEAAADFVRTNPWLQEAARDQVPPKEWRRLLDYLSQQRFRAGTGPDATDFSVGEAVSLLGLERHAETTVPREQIARALGQQGLLVLQSPNSAEGFVVMIANQSAQVARWLQGTPWAGSWRPTLLRAPGVQTKDPKYFPGLSSMHRSVAIPLRVMLGLDSPAEDHLSV
jgi:putative DNA primase/helicase